MKSEYMFNKIIIFLHVLSLLNFTAVYWVLGRVAFLNTDFLLDQTCIASRNVGERDPTTNFHGNRFGSFYAILLKIRQR